MRFILDTNVVIRMEDHRKVESVCAELSRLTAGKHDLLLHPASRDDVARDRDRARRIVIESKLGKYKTLEVAMEPDDGFRSAVGPGSRVNDSVDIAVLYALHRDAADFLITEDDGLHRRARRVSEEERVLTVAQAVALLRTLERGPPARHNLVRRVPIYTLDRDDPFFDSIRADYSSGFETWFQKISREGRPCYAFVENRRIRALMIFKEADEHGIPGLPRPLFKISTLKVDEPARGLKLGELFIKLAVWFAFQRRSKGVFVTVYEKHEGLRRVFEDFGFSHVRDSTGGELVYFKDLRRPTAGSETRSDPAGFMRRHYPYLYDGGAVRKFIVPIQPGYHSRLFPETSDRQTLIDEYNEVIVQGNTIRKAYLCHAATRMIHPGSVLLFYRSGDHQAVTSIGVAETIFRTTDVTKVVSRVGRRTVYSLEEIRKLCRKPLLAILFWHLQDVSQRISLAQLKSEGVLRGSPQSIMELKENAYRKWKGVAGIEDRSTVR